MTIERILDLHFKDYQQQSFSIKPFAEKAQALADQHRLVNSSINYLENKNTHSISRRDLINLYRSEEDFFIKILITFWWGGISHKDQAPKFYKKENLDKIIEFSPKLEHALQCTLTGKGKDFQDKLRIIFDGLAFGDYKMDGIGIAFFTKIFQFFYESHNYSQNGIMLPIIADKWSMRAVLGYSILDGNPVKFFRSPSLNKRASDFTLNFKGYNKSQFSKYWDFISYFDEMARMLSRTYISLTPFQLEEILFGWQKDILNPQNPRHLFTKAISQHYKLGISDFE